MLEAMSCACPLVLSDTEPVREFADDASASIVSLSDPRSIAAAVTDLLSDTTASPARRTGARERIRTSLSQPMLYDLKQGLFASLR